MNMFFKRCLFILLFVLLAGVFLIPVETQAKELVCRCFYKCDKQNQFFDKGPYVFGILAGGKVTECADNQIKSVGGAIPSSFTEKLKEECESFPLSFAPSDYIGSCTPFFEIVPESISNKDNKIGQQVNFSVHLNLADENTQEIKSFSCVTCDGSKIPYSVSDGEKTITVNWLTSEAVNSTQSANLFTFKGVVDEGDYKGVNLEQEVAVSLFPSTPAIPAAPPEKGALGCYCKVDDGQEKQIIVGLSTKSACIKSQIFEGKKLTECEWNVSGEQEIDIKGLDTTVLNKLGTTDVREIIGRAVKTSMGIIGSIALVMFLYGGFLWMTAGGNSEHEKKARDIIIWSSLGVIVILASYALVSFIFGAFQ